MFTNCGIFLENGNKVRLNVVKNTLGARLRALRLAREVTQRELAHYLHIGSTAIANYENDSRQPDLERLVRIAVFFGVSVDHLLGRDEQVIDIPITETELEDAFKNYLTKLRLGDRKKALQIVWSLLDRGATTEDIFKHFIERSLYVAGNLWEKGEFSIWQEHLVSEFSDDLLGLLLKQSTEAPALSKKKTFLTFLPGAERHAIGLKMVGHMLQVAGYKVYPLGTCLPDNELLAAVETLKPHALCLSVTLPSHLQAAAQSIQSLRDTCGARTPQIVVGGMAFRGNTDPAGSMDADLYYQTPQDLLSSLAEGIS